MVRWVRTCTTCGNISERLYRCDDCGDDLADSPSPIWRFQWPSVAGRRDNGLVAVEFPLECCRCETTQWLELDYQYVGRVIRLRCSACESATKHRPVGEDLRRAAAASIDGETAASGDDHDPLISTA